MCLYHRIDFDGECSAAIVRRKYNNDVELIGWNYGDPIPWGALRGNEVWLVDLTFQPNELMLRLAGIADTVVWLDHHISSILDARDTYVELLSGRRDVNYSGCELTWKHCYSDEVMPEAVLLLGRYDTWTWESLNPGGQERVLDFQYGMRGGLDTNPRSYWWDNLLDVPAISSNLVESVICDGRVIRRYQKRQNEDLVREAAFETVLDGHKVLAVNGGRGSLTFASVWAEHPDCEAMVSFQWVKGMWLVRVYSDRGLSCGDLCKSYGGGGHKGAGGFRCASLPFVCG